METYKARMDVRGFLRFPKEMVKKFKLKDIPYADVFVDKAGGRIGIVPTKKLKTTSFRIFSPTGTATLYLRGAMNSVGLKVVSGDVTLSKEGNMFIFQNQKKASAQAPEWSLFACRNSAGLPMASIDPRGTMILDKRCVEALDTQKNPTMTPEYDSKKKLFTLSFGKNGLVNVRTIESHASFSMMGTFHSFGVNLPESHTRYPVQIDGNILKFKAV